MEDKKAFIMYTEYDEYLEDLTDEELGQLMRIIFKYEKTGEIPKNLGFLMKMAFNFIKGNLDRNREKYDKRSITSVINGKKGGRPKKEKPNSKPNEKPNKPKKTLNDNDKENDNVNVNENDNVNVKENENDRSNSFCYCEKQFGRSLASSEINKITKWEKWFEDDVINYAIDKTILNGARSLNYTEAIINSWYDKGFKTLDDCQKESRERKVSQEQKQEFEFLDSYDWLHED